MLFAFTLAITSLHARMSWQRGGRVTSKECCVIPSGSPSEPGSWSGEIIFRHLHSSPSVLGHELLGAHYACFLSHVVGYCNTGCCIIPHKFYSYSYGWFKMMIFFQA
jgi:hypothetical protein